MDILKDFDEKGFPQQIAILEEIEVKKDHATIDELFKLVQTITNDILHHMIDKTLRVLLSENEEKTLAALASDNEAAKKLCIEIAGQQRLEAAVPILEDLTAIENNTRQLFEILSALSLIAAERSLEIFRRHMDHTDPMIVMKSIEMIEHYKDTTSIGPLAEIIKKAEEDDNYEECDLLTAKAIEVMGSINNEEVTAFLSTKIHHRNPTARRIIHEQLIKIGKKAIPFLSPYFSHDDVDLKIMAADVLGELGGKETGQLLVNALDKKTTDDVNVRCAIYQALGKISSIKGAISLLDGLLSDNEIILITIVTALNQQTDPRIIKSMKRILDSDSSQNEKIIQVIIRAEALNIFEALYEEEKLGKKLIETLQQSQDQQIITAFCERLEQMGTKASDDLDKIKQLTAIQADKRILAVDDSKSILLFYRHFFSTVGMAVETAENGQEALDILEKDPDFDLIIVDMNMPVMDGIDMTRKVRDNIIVGELPIFMVTSESKGDQVKLAEKAGVNKFLKKPIDKTVFQDEIESFFSNKD